MEQTRKLMDQEFSGRQAWRYAESIAQYNRIQASPGYRDAAVKIVSLLQREGVEARIEDFPARTGQRFFSRQSFQEWRCRGGELWLNLPQGGRRRLARYQEQEVSLIQRSAPTPPEGIEAELVHVPDAANPTSYGDVDVRGKFVLGRGNPMTVHRLAVEKHGAVGIILDNLNQYPPLRSRADLPDAIQYTSFWWSGHEQPGFGFCVSPRVGDELRELLQKEKVQLWAQVDAELVDGTLENVEYFIPGQRQEEVLLLAHLCHPYPGAQDNASGPAVLMEVARTLHRLLEQGDLPQPELGIRILLVPEMTGTFAYFHRYPQRMQTTVAAFNLDMVGADQGKGGGPLCIEQPPLGTPTFLDRYAHRILTSISTEYGNFTDTNGYSSCYFLATRFSGGSDHYVVSDPSIGVPCPMAIQWPDKHYHTSLDHPTNLDPGMLKRVGLMTGLYAWGLAAGKEEDWLDYLLADVAGRSQHMYQVLEWALTQDMLQGQLQEVLDFHLDYEAKALEQLRNYAKLRCLGQVEDEIDWAQDYLAEAGQHLRNWVCQRDGINGQSTSGPQLSTDLAGKVFQRAYPGPLDLSAELAQLPRWRQEEWGRYAGESKVPGSYTTILMYWLDGVRPLGEVLELTKLETGAWYPEYALKYLELCEELGLVRTVQG